MSHSIRCDFWHNTDVKVQLQPTHGCEVLIVLRRLQLTASTFCSVYVFILCPQSARRSCPANFSNIRFWEIELKSASRHRTSY